MDLDGSCPLGDPYLSLYTLEEVGLQGKYPIWYYTIACGARRARLDLVGWATSDGAAHVFSCGYRGP